MTALENIEKIKKSIRNPRFYYAEYNPVTGEIRYKMKKFIKWNSSERVVKIKYWR